MRYNPIAVGRKIELPNTGIHTDDGFFFHQVGTRNLTQEEINRLHEFGVGYVQWKHFKDWEDEIIRKNWEDFSKEYNLDHGKILSFAGAGDRHGNNQIYEEKNKREFCKETNFWPKMCSGLPHRSGHQVKRRILNIFEKTCDTSKRQCLTPEEFQQFLEEYTRTESIRSAAETIQKPYILCQNRYFTYLRSSGAFTQKGNKALWTVINELTEVDNNDFKKLIKKAIRKGDREKILELTQYIKFDNISFNVMKTKEKCQEEWTYIIDRLLVEYPKALSNHTKKKAAWKEAIEYVFPEKVGLISPEKFSLFLRVLTESIDKDYDDYIPLKKKCIKMDGLYTKMSQFGICGFWHNKSLADETDYLIKKIQTVLSKSEERFFSQLAMKYILSEKLKILTMAFDRQIEVAGGQVPTIETAIEPLSLDNKNIVMNWEGYAAIYTPFIIEALILFSMKLDPEWIPPTSFKSFVKDDNILKLFPESENDAALLSKDLIEEYRAHDDEDIRSPQKKRKK